MASLTQIADISAAALAKLKGGRGSKADAAGAQTERTQAADSNELAGPTNADCPGTSGVEWERESGYDDGSGGGGGSAAESAAAAEATGDPFPLKDNIGEKRSYAQQLNAP